MSLLLAFTLIAVLFAVLLTVKSKAAWRFCAICLAISLAWLGLLLAYHAGMFDNVILLALLMGQSITGIYYLLEKRVPKKWLVFRLPALLTLAFIFYGSITLDFAWQAATLLVSLWIIAGLLFVYQTNLKIKRIARKLIDCCGNW